MSVRNLDYFFHPGSVAVVGASNKPHSVGATVLKNVVAGGFKGDIFPINLKYDQLLGLKTYSTIADLPKVPELAIICTPPATVPELIAQLGAYGTKAVIVLTAGLSAVKDRYGKSMKDLMQAAAKPYLLRILGPNCVGLLAPHVALNASFAHVSALSGKIAFVSQSGAMVTGVLDWANSRGIGFSKFISLGDSADVDFGDLLDYLSSDPDTHAILLYAEAVTSARKFMSAARAAARSKPTLIVKAGRVPEGAKAAASHTGALAGSDDVYDAAIRRAGMLRVLTTEDLFDAVETLARARPITGNRLAILTNGGGPGVMATDTLIAAGGKLGTLSEKSIQMLDKVLPANWSRGNPVDIIGDAPAERYVQALEVIAQDPNVDAILSIHAPTAIVPSSEIASTLIPAVKDTPQNILACWLGGDSVSVARHMFSDAGLPTYDTPEKAVRGFMQMVRYQQNQQLLMEVPSAGSHQFGEDRSRACQVVQQVLASGRNMLSEFESKIVLGAYGIPVVETRVVETPEQAVSAATGIGYPVALKILSPDISHKSDVGGVVLNLGDEDAVQRAATAMLARLQGLKPEAKLTGFTVQAMALRPEGRELIIGIATDPVFGPVILFGQGGIAVEITSDHAIAFPPLNMVLARNVISRTRVAKLLGGYRNRAPADMDAICQTLMQISDMIVDIPEIAELDINPLIADADGVIALDARIRVVSSAETGVDKLAIKPYPARLEQWIDWHGERILLRPIRPEDGAAHVEFFNALEPEDVRYRMFIRMRELSPPQLARFTQIDYDREMAFIATRQRASGQWETLGVVRVISDPDNIQAEFAVTVRSDLKGRGLGQILMEKVIAYSREHGTQEIVGEALNDNRPVLNLASHLGFELHPSPDNGTTRMRLRISGS
jgi:acetyltransferase